MEPRLMLGDCLDRLSEIEDGSVDMILADLPYGTTSCKWDSVIPFEPLWAHYRRVTKPNAAIVLTASQPFTSALVMSNPTWFRDEWIWYKNAGTNFANARRQPLREHESIMVFASGGTTYTPVMRERMNERAIRAKRAPNHSSTTQGSHGFGTKPQIVQYDPNSRYPGTVLSFDVVPNSGGGKVHPTQKPVHAHEPPLDQHREQIVHAGRRLERGIGVRVARRRRQAPGHAGDGHGDAHLLRDDDALGLGGRAGGEDEQREDGGAHHSAAIRYGCADAMRCSAMAK